MQKIYLTILVLMFAPAVSSQDCVVRNVESNFFSKLDFFDLLKKARMESRTLCMNQELAMRAFEADKKYWSGQSDSDFRGDLADISSDNTGLLTLANGNRVIRYNSIEEAGNRGRIDTVKRYRSSGVLGD